MKIYLSHLIIIGIIFYILIYEIVFFFIDGTSFQPFTNFFKLFFPFVLLLYGGFNYRLIFRNKYTLYFLIFYSSFIAWLFVLNIIKDGFSFGFLEALRQLPRFIFLIGLVQFFLREKGSKEKIIKIIVIYSLFITTMHLVLILNPTMATVSLLGIEFAGPFGLFGNVNSRLYVPSFQTPIYRLAGWFNEPSNASAFLLASYFLSKSIQNNMPKTVIWKYSPIICLIGGLATFSNAGYFAIGFSLTVISILSIKYFKHSQFILKNYFIIVIAIIGIIIALFGRHYLVKEGIDSETLSVITGANKRYFDDPYYDPTAGRINLMNLTLEKITTHPLGIGFQQSAKDVPAGAPLFWLLLAGIPGVSLILSRESVIVFIAKKKYIDREFIYQYGALLTVMVQQSIYGQWNNAFYYLLISNLLVKISTKQ